MIELPPILPLKEQVMSAIQHAEAQIIPDAASTRHSLRLEYRRAQDLYRDETLVDSNSALYLRPNQVISEDAADLATMLDIFADITGEESSWARVIDKKIEHEQDHEEAAWKGGALACRFMISISYRTHLDRRTKHYVPSDGKQPFVSGMAMPWYARRIPIITFASVCARPSELSGTDIGIMQRFGYQNAEEADERIVRWNASHPDHQLLRPRSCIEVGAEEISVPASGAA